MKRVRRRGERLASRRLLLPRQDRDKALPLISLRTPALWRSHEIHALLVWISNPVTETFKIKGLNPENPCCQRPLRLSWQRYGNTFPDFVATSCPHPFLEAAQLKPVFLRDIVELKESTTL